jgi:hypothetical protein
VSISAEPEFFDLLLGGFDVVDTVLVEELKAPVGLGGTGAAMQRQLNPNKNNKAIPSVAVFCNGENK